MGQQGCFCLQTLVLTLSGKPHRNNYRFSARLFDVRWFISLGIFARIICYASNVPVNMYMITVTLSAKL